MFHATTIIKRYIKNQRSSYFSLPLFVINNDCNLKNYIMCKIRFDFFNNMFFSLKFSKIAIYKNKGYITFDLLTNIIFLIFHMRI